VVNNEHHPLAKDNEIRIEKGNQMPLIPQHIAKAGIDYNFKNKGYVGIDAILNGNQYLRGDESNLLEPLHAFLTLNFRAEYRFNTALAVFGRIQNLLNNRYETFGLLGNPREVENFKNLFKPQFLTPNTPLAFNIGIRWTL
jgi:iron complex outermembrane recepter protein